MKIEIEISDDVIHHLILVARNGYSHWCVSMRRDVAQGQCSYVVEEGDSGKASLNGNRHRFGARELTRALTTMARLHPRHFAAVISNTGDNHTANVLVQLATFGELKYA